MRLRAASIAAAVVLFALPALAQNQAIDPRLAEPLIRTQQAEIALRDAIIKAMHEDAAKREAEWAEYAKPLWQQPEPPK